MSLRLKVLIGSAVLLAAVIGGGLWWFLRDDAPPEVSLEDAVKDVEGTGDGDDAGGVDGAWVIDTDSGTFDLEEATGTFAGYRVEEELAGIGANRAVGRTGDVSGSFTVEGTTVSEAEFEVDLTGLTSDESLRDGQAQNALETSTFPVATFTLTEPVDFGDGAAQGDPVAVTAPGELTIHGVTNRVDFPMDAQLVDGTIVLVGSLELTLADYDIDVPTTAIALSVSDEGTLEFQFLLTRS